MRKGELLEALIAFLCIAGGDLVGGHHGDAVGQGLFIDLSGDSTGGVVDQYAVFQIHASNGLNKGFWRAVCLGLGQLGLPIARNAGIGEQHLAAVGQAHDAQVQAANVFQFFPLGQDLVNHGSAHVAHAHAKDVQSLDFGFEEGLVQRLQGLSLVLCVDYNGDVALGGPLGDGPDANAIASKCPQMPGR